MQKKCNGLVVVCTMPISLQAAPYFVVFTAVYLDILAPIEHALYYQQKKAILGPICLEQYNKNKELCTTWVDYT